MFIVGAGLVAYSWIGAVVEIATEFETAVDANETSSALSKIFYIITTGELPQLTGFFYIGIFTIVISVLYLVGIFKKHPKMTDDSLNKTKGAA